MKTLFSTSIQLTGFGALLTALPRWFDTPSLRSLTPIGYLFLAAGALLLIVVTAACLSSRWESPCSQDSPD